MRRDDIEQMIDPTVDDHLRIWARYMKRGTFCKGYASRSAGFTAGGINCWDDLEEEHMSATATAVNTVMVDLADKDYISISNFYCGRGVFYNDSEVEYLISATDRFEKKAIERGLL